MNEQSVSHTGACGHLNEWVQIGMHAAREAAGPPRVGLAAKEQAYKHCKLTDSGTPHQSV